jgi:hypothetical protein
MPGETETRHAESLSNGVHTSSNSTAMYKTLVQYMNREKREKKRVVKSNNETGKRGVGPCKSHVHCTGFPRRRLAGQGLFDFQTWYYCIVQLPEYVILS